MSLRFTRQWGPHRIGYHLGIPRSTVGRVLARYGMPLLHHLDRATGLPVRKPKPVRYEKETPGELVHVDIKKLSRIPDGGGWRMLGRQAGNRNKKRQGLGYAFLHHAVDDCTRLAYSEQLDDERKETAAAFWERARAFFADHGITVTAVMTDNGSCYRSHAFADALGGDRTTPDTTVAGDLSVHGAPDSGNGAIIDSLEYRAVLQPVPAGSTQGPACAAEAFTASAQYVFGSSGAWQPMATVASAAGTQRVAAAQGDTLQYCFEVRLRDDAPNDAQGTRAAFTWTWDATSVSAG